MRYVGQSYELTLEMAASASDQIAAAVAAFHARHKALYGHSNSAAPVEFVSLRTVHVRRPDDRRPPLARPISGQPGPIAYREAYFEDSGGFVRTPVYDRRTTCPGHLIVGPAIIEQADTTLIVYPRQRAQLRQDRSILVDIPHAQ
jgi:N-methylhydantoinase A